MPGVVHFWGPYPYRSAFHSETEEQERERALAHLRDTIMVEGAAHGRGDHPRDRRRHQRHPRPAATATCRACATLCDEHGIVLIADEVMAGLRPLRRVVRRRPLGRHARPHHLRQGRQLRLRPARRRRHLRRDRGDLRPAGLPGRPDLLRPPARLRRRPSPRSTSSARRASSRTPASSAPTSSARAARDRRAAPARRRRPRPRRLLGRRARARPRRPASRSCRSTPPARRPRRWASSRPRARSAGCGRSPTSTAPTSCRRARRRPTRSREGLAVLDEALDGRRQLLHRQLIHAPPWALRTSGAAPHADRRVEADPWRRRCVARQDLPAAGGDRTGLGAGRGANAATLRAGDVPVGALVPGQVCLLWLSGQASPGCTPSAPWR